MRRGAGGTLGALYVNLQSTAGTVSALYYYTNLSGSAATVSGTQRQFATNAGTNNYGLPLQAYTLYETMNILPGGLNLAKNLNNLQFELTDHLGNVRAVASGVTTTASDGSLRATVLLLTDYYPSAPKCLADSLALETPTGMALKDRNMTRKTEIMTSEPEYTTPKLQDGRAQMIWQMHIRIYLLM